MPQRRKNADNRSPRPAIAETRGESAPVRRAEEPTAPFRRRILVGSLIVIALMVLLYFLWQAVYVLLLIFTGVLLAILLRSLAAGVSKVTRLPDGWSLALVVLMLLGLLALLVWMTAAPLSNQIDQLAERVPGSIESFKQRISHYKWGQWLVGNLPTTQDLETGSRQMRWRAAGALISVIDVVIGTIVVVFIGLYLAAEPDLYTRGILHLVPHTHRELGARILASVRYTLQWWLIGQGVTMLVIGILTAAGLWLIGVPLWFLLGLLAALFNFIPNFGPFISYIPAVLLALAISPGKAIGVTILFILAQSFEGYVLTPLVQRRAVLLPPAIGIAAQVLLGVTVGSLGLIVAAPLTAAVLVVVKMLYVEQTLGDQVETPDDHLPKSELPPIPK